MPSGPVSGRVYIWYPEGQNIGHAAMYLGNYEVGQRFELSLDPGSPNHVMPSALEKSFGADKIHFNMNYVSWWPGAGAGITTPKTQAEPMLGLYGDVASEASEPHVVYDVYGLDVVKMRSAWQQIRSKPGASYHLFRKNCSDIVLRVLVAGGALRHLSPVKAAWFGHNAITTPKKVAQLCNELRDAGWATKTKAGNCPPREGKLMRFLGMR